ncbi:aryl-sulfate sulfotransferase, partial [Bacteroidota bacterium]
HPLPNSKFVSPSTTIIIRFNEHILFINKNDLEFSVTGALSGNHKGDIVYISNSKTFIFKPFNLFEPQEQVCVTIKSSLLDLNYIFSFEVSSIILPNVLDYEDSSEEFATSVKSNKITGFRLINGVSVPGDYPDFLPSIINNPAQDLLFISTANDPYKYSMILNNDGTPYYYKKSTLTVRDFTIQNGYITLVEGVTAKVMDRNFNLKQRYNCGHGYRTDKHEFRLLPNSNAILIARDAQIVDMSQLVEGGSDSALVKGRHVQEVDTAGNVIFEWRCWDHFNITDALNIDLTAQTIDYVHMNAIEVDYDGHLLLSSRHLSEITKINRNTGKIIWRLGGANNQFVLLGDTHFFSFQHDIRAVPGKQDHYTLFDNGNFNEPRISRAVEYKIDTLNMTAENVWEFSPTPEGYSNKMGSVQRLENGNTIIGWAVKRLPKITEVSTSGEILYEGDFSVPIESYRVHRHECDFQANKPYLLVDYFDEQKITLLFNHFGKTDILKYYIYADTIQSPLKLIDSTNNPYIHLTNLTNNKINYFRVTSIDSSGTESRFSNQEEVLTKFIQPGDNIISNGDFSEGINNWNLITQNQSTASINIDSTEICQVLIETASGNLEDISLYQDNLLLIQEKFYQLQFDVNSSEDKILEVNLYDKEKILNYSKIGLIIIDDKPAHYSFDFQMNDASDPLSILLFNLGYSSSDVYLDNVSLNEIITTQ